jgi:hypothetical protein
LGTLTIVDPIDAARSWLQQKWSRDQIEARLMPAKYDCSALELAALEEHIAGADCRARYRSAAIAACRPVRAGGLGGADPATGFGVQRAQAVDRRRQQATAS